MPEVGERLGGSTEVGLLMGGLHHAHSSFILCTAYCFVMFHLVFMKLFLTLFLWSHFDSC